LGRSASYGRDALPPQYPIKRKCIRGHHMELTSWVDDTWFYQPACDHGPCHWIPRNAPFFYCYQCGFTEC